MAGLMHKPMKKILTYLVLSLVLSTLFANSSFGQILTPQGRLTLQSNTPVMNTDVVGATTVYYTPYVGNSLPSSNGTSLSNQTFSQLSLSPNVVTDQVIDIFAFYQSSTFLLCSQSWNSATVRGTTQALTTLQGIWVNANAITCFGNSPTNYNVSAKQGIYLGTVYTGTYVNYSTMGITVSLHPTAALGGTRNLVGIWNAYNRVPYYAFNRDSTASWTNSYTGGWSVADGADNFNQVAWVDGLQQTQTKARFSLLGSTNANASALLIGVLLDNTSGTPDLTAGMTFGTASNWNTTMEVEESFPPQLGLHYVQAMDAVQGSGPTGTFFGSGFESLMLDGEY